MSYGNPESVQETQIPYEQLEELGVVPKNMLSAVTLMFDPEKVDVGKIPEGVYFAVADALTSLDNGTSEKVGAGIETYFNRLEKLGLPQNQVRSGIALMFDPEKADQNKIEGASRIVADALTSFLENHFASGAASYFQEGQTPDDIYREHVRKTPFYLP